MDTLSNLETKLLNLLQVSGFNAQRIYNWITIREKNLRIEINLRSGKIHFYRKIIRFHTFKYPFRFSLLKLAKKTENWTAIVDGDFLEFEEKVCVEINKEIRDVFIKLFQNL